MQEIYYSFRNSQRGNSPLTPKRKKADMDDFSVYDLGLIENCLRTRIITVEGYPTGSGVEEIPEDKKQVYEDFVSDLKEVQVRINQLILDKSDGTIL